MTTESDLATAASASDPRVGLRAVRALRRLLEELERTQVLRARRAGLVVGRDRRGAGGQPAGRAQEVRQGLSGSRACWRGSRSGRARWSSAPSRSRPSRGRARSGPSTCSRRCCGTTTASPSRARRRRAATASGCTPSSTGAGRSTSTGSTTTTRPPWPASASTSGRSSGGSATSRAARRSALRAGCPRRFSRPAKKVLELSLREAVSLRHNYIGTEHLLLGLVREGDVDRPRHPGRRRRRHRATLRQAVARGVRRAG